MMRYTDMDRDEMMLRYTDMDRDGDELQNRNHEESVWIPQDLSKEPKQPEKELVLMAFGSSSQAIIVWCNDGLVNIEVTEAGSYETASYIIDNEAPDHGIWVWEGKVHFSKDYFGEYGDPEYRTIQWRQPTGEEWEAIKEQRNPFKPKPKEDQEWSNWGQKTVL